MAVKGGGSGGSAGAVKAGGAFVEIFSDDSKLVRGLKRAEQRLKAFGKATAITGAGVLGAGAGILGGLGAVVEKTLGRDVALSRLSSKLGVSTERMSEFAYAASLAGQSLEDVEGHFENFAERVGQAALGTGEGLEAFKRLGIDPNELIKQDTITQAETLADALKNVKNETERLAIMSQLGGDKFQMLNTTLRNGSAGLKLLYADAKRTGSVLSQEDADRALRVQMSLNRVWAAGESILYAVGDSLLSVMDGFKNLVDPAIAVIGAARQWITENGYLVAGLAALGIALVVAGGALIAFGATSVAVGSVVSGVMAVVSGFAAVLAFFTWPIIAVTAGVIALGLALAALGYFWLTETKSGEAFSRSLKEHALTSLANLAEAWGSVLQALKSGDLGLAARISFVALAIEFQRGVLAIQSIWWDFTHALSDELLLGLADAMSKFRVEIKSIVDLIVQAMRLIPGLNKGLDMQALQAFMAQPDLGAAVKGNVLAAKAADRLPLEIKMRQLEAELADLKARAGQLAADAANGKVPGVGGGGLSQASGVVSALVTGGLGKQIFGGTETDAQKLVRLQIEADKKRAAALNVFLKQWEKSAKQKEIIIDLLHTLAGKSGMVFGP